MLALLVDSVMVVVLAGNGALAIPVAGPFTYRAVEACPAGATVPRRKNVTTAITSVHFRFMTT